MYALLLTLAALSIGEIADLLVLPPDRYASEAHGASRQLIGQGRDTIEVFVALSPKLTKSGTAPEAYVLRFTGGDAAGSSVFTAWRWGSRPVEVWCANYPGYGGSRGPKSLARMTPLALATFDHLRRVARDRPIFVEGFSLGALPALALAARRPVAGVVLQNPPPLRQLILGEHGWWNLWVLSSVVVAEIPEDLDSVANAHGATAPLVFIMADCDRTIPPKYQRLIYEQYRGSKRLMIQQGADHFVPFTAQEDAEFQQDLDWAWSQTSASSVRGAGGR